MGMDVKRKTGWRAWRRFVLLLLLAGVGLQLYFLARVIMLRYIDPGSSAFERSQISQLHQHQSQPRGDSVRRRYVRQPRRRAMAGD